MEPNSSSSSSEESQLSLILGDSSIETLVFVIISEIDDLENVRQARRQIQTCLDRSPNATSRILVNLLLGGSTIETKMKIAKFLLKSLNAPGTFLWSLLDETTRIEVKIKLLKFVQREVDSSIGEELTVEIMELGKRLLNSNGWNELFPFFESLNFDSEPCLVTDVSVVSQIATNIPDSLEAIHAIYANSLSFPDIHMRFASLHDITNFSNSPEFNSSTIQTLFPLIIDAIGDCVNSAPDSQLLIHDIKKLVKACNYHGIDTSNEFESNLEQILFLLSQDEASIAILESSDISPFENLVLATLSNINDLQSRALYHFDLLKQNRLNQFIYKLCLTLSESTHPPIQEELVRFLRLELRGIWEDIEPSRKALLKRSLIGCLLNSADQALSSFLNFLMNDMLSDPSIGWPELPYILLEWAVSHSDYHKRRALDLLAIIFSHGNVGVIPPLRTMHSLFRNSLSRVETIQVRMAALSATMEYISSLSMMRELRLCRDLIPELVQVLSDASDFGEYALLQSGLDLLSSMASDHPSFLNTNIDSMVEALLQFAEKIAWGQCRFKAVGLLLRLAEWGFLLRSPQASASRLIGILLKLVHEEILHAPQNDADENDADDLNTYLTRLARSKSMVKGRITGVALENLNLYAESAEWEKRYAAVTAINRMSSGFLVGNLDQLVNMLLKAVGDTETKVRTASIDCIRKLRQILGNEFRDTFGDRILPVLNQARNDYSNVRVQVYAHQALLEFQNG